jgi:hypothetical protein
VIARSALFALATMTVALALFVVIPGTMLLAVAVSVSVMLVPEGVAGFTCSTKVKFAVVLAARLAIVQLGGAVAMLHVHPAGPVRETTVVFGGTGSVNETVVAAAGPLFVTLCVYVTLPPAATEAGAAEFVVTKSACVAVATTSLAVAVLLAAFGSETVELAVTVSLIAVPAGVPAVTVTTKLIVAGVAEARDGFVQVKVPTLQVHPAGPFSDTAVVFAGRASVTVTPVAVLGPALFTTCV